MIKIYGINNCTTVKKALAWLEENNISHDFHDYKKEGVDLPVLKKVIAEKGWEKAINRASMSWRKIPEDVRERMDVETAIQCAIENNSLIKRPLVVNGDDILLGFNEKRYAEKFL